MPEVLKKIEQAVRIGLAPVVAVAVFGIGADAFVRSVRAETQPEAEDACDMPNEGYIHEVPVGPISVNGEGLFSKRFMNCDRIVLAGDPRLQPGEVLVIGDSYEPSVAGERYRRYSIVDESLVDTSIALIDDTPDRSETGKTEPDPVK